MMAMKPDRLCILCGKKMRSHNRYEWCQKHGRGLIDAVTRRCRKCGETVPVKSAGGHATVCRHGSAWNKGLTSATSDAVRRYGEKRRGIPAPEHVKAALRASVKTEKWARAHAAGQKRRFANPEEREVVSARARALIAAGKVVPYGGRGHGNGKPATSAEVEMRRRLGPIGFKAEVTIATKKQTRAKWYRIDLAHEKLKIAVELDGTSHGLARRRTDAEKTSFLESKGWLVVRFRGGDFDSMQRECERLVQSRTAMSGI